jgi:surface protein
MNGYTIDGDNGYILFESASALVDGVNFSWSPVNLEGAFRYDGNFNGPLSNWDTSGCTKFLATFGGANSFNQDIGGWDVSSGTTFRSMFQNAYIFNQDIGGWTLNTSLSVDMSRMFYQALNFNQDIGGWNTGAVDDMSYMFFSAWRFNNGGVGGVGLGIDQWDTSNVSTMQAMFQSATDFNQYIGSWDTSSLGNMRDMFRSSPFNNGDAAGVSGGGVGIGMDNWDTSSVTDMTNMFNSNANFNQYIGSWDTSSVTSMAGTFLATSSFNQDIGGWNTSSVTAMNNMFASATAFDQNLGSWNISSLTDASGMLTGTALTTPNYDALLIGWAAQAPAIQSGVTLSVVPCQYTLAAQSARDLLTGTYGWSILDQGVAVTPTIFTVDTSQTATGSSAADQYQLTFSALGSAIDATVYWGDGTNDVVTSTTDPALLHTYPAAGTYQIEIHATDPSVRLTTNPVFGSKSQGVQGECLKVTSIDQWGDCTFDSNVDDYYLANIDNVTSLPAVGPIQIVASNGAFYSWGAIANANMDGYNVLSDLPPSSNVSSELFENSSLLTGGVNFSWSAVGSLEGAFYSCTSFNGSISNWDFSGVVTLKNFFYLALSFNQDISHINLTSCIRTDSMFNRATSFNNGSVGGLGVGLDTWDMSSIQNVNSMFQQANSFNQYIGSWGLTSCTTMYAMFRQALAFNQDIGGWNTSSVSNMSFMFYDASSFNQDIGGWNTAAVSNMSNMFNSASSFNQNISSWNISSLTNAAGMFTNSGLSTANYDALLIGWAAQAPAIQSGVTLSVIPVNFTTGGAAEAGYNLLTGTYGWTIIDPAHP